MQESNSSVNEPQLRLGFYNLINQMEGDYEKAFNRKDGKNTIVVEYGDFYSEK